MTAESMLSTCNDAGNSVYLIWYILVNFPDHQ